MRTIILPGYSAHNREWAEEAEKRFKDKNQKALVHYWKHWTQGNFSLRQEVSRILQEVGSEKINILAKSVGTLVGVKLVLRIRSQVGRIILCGIPSTSEVRKRIYREALEDFPRERVVCFQNSQDPFASYEEVKKFLSEINPGIKVIEKARNDHNYPYFDDFLAFLGNSEK